MVNKDVDEILKKYSRKLEGEIHTDIQENLQDVESFSREYTSFKRDMMPSLSKYENWAKSLGNTLKIKLAKKDELKISENLNTAHLEVTPSQAISLASAIFLLGFLATILISTAIFLLKGPSIDNFPFVFLLLGLFFSMFLFYYYYSMPARLANKWRLKASSQMVPAILYVVVYMKHTSNLERAIRFASQHLQEPLSLDFRKIFWDVETGRFSTIKESLDNYLESWRNYSMEFIESFHLIESSLYEPTDDRRIQVLERSLQVILDGVYDKMLKYTHSVRSPLTNLYMLGIILPTLGLALLPLASTLLLGLLQWYHILILFNLLIPFLVFYMTNDVMMKRPGGYGETDTLEKNPLYPKYKSKKPYLIAFLICFPLLILGFLPFLFQYTPLPSWFGLQTDYTFTQIGIPFLGDMKIFDFIETEGGGFVGPFGPLSLLLSLFVPLSIALFFSLVYSMKTKELIKARNSSRDLEQEFTSSLFQLGNRIGDGIPAEIAFSKVAESTRGTVTEDFFRIVNSNLHQAGMSLDQAIFNDKRGAIIYYPSELIKMSMKILVESVKKGLQVAARSLMSISEYVKNIHKINQRLRDLLAEIISDMKSNMTFLAPLLAGVVVGLAGMITLILNKLKTLLTSTPTEGLETGGAIGAGNLGTITTIFDITKMIPPYFLQMAIGIYLIEIVFILTNTLITLDAGEDRLRRINETGKNLKFSMILYLVTALLAMTALSVLASVALAGLVT